MPLGHTNGTSRRRQGLIESWNSDVLNIRALASLLLSFVTLKRFICTSQGQWKTRTLHENFLDICTLYRMLSATLVQNSPLQGICGGYPMQH